MQTSWLKQSPDQPLFPEILWSRPENKRLAGKLLIIGGNSHEFKAPAAAFGLAEQAGAGSVRTILPDSLAKSVGKIFPEAVFAPSTPSGSLARLTLADFMDQAEWADVILLAGDFGKNSETAVLLQSLADKFSGQITLAGDTVETFYNGPEILSRPQTLICAELPALQKLLAGQGVLIKQSMNLSQLVEILAHASTKFTAHILTTQGEQAIVASGGQVATMPTKVSLAELAARASVFWLQNPNKPFEALASSVL